MKKSSDKILQDFFGHDADNTSLMRLDGYFTALGIGPNLIMPSQWMEGLLEKRPPLKDLVEAQEISGALMERYNYVMEQINGPIKKYRPSCLTNDPDVSPSLERVTAWAEGFYDGMNLDQGWRVMMEDADASTFVGPILAYVKAAKKEKVKSFTPDELVIMLDTMNAHMAEILLMVRDKWRKNTVALQPPAVHEPRMGRNELCHCGSGKKYKRCCGVN
jgi:uncharacterized protein